MSEPVLQGASETEIRALLDGWCQAVNAMDLDTILACYAPDIRAFDAAAALEFVGRDAYRAHWEACMTQCPAMVFEMHGLEVAAGDDIAFASYLVRCGGAGADGNPQLAWMRASVGCRRTDDGWRVTHEHFSAPFDPLSFKAMFDLHP